ncbi:MAG: hypothetical protein MZU91_11740 [Desulfosudis oleivorans]|nr:hypothetical protein [Desulfosudis oleivorans]
MVAALAVCSAPRAGLRPGQHLGRDKPRADGRGGHAGRLGSLRVNAASRAQNAGYDSRRLLRLSRRARPGLHACGRPPGPGASAPQQEGRPGCSRQPAIRVLPRHGEGTGLEQYVPGPGPFRARQGLSPGWAEDTPTSGSGLSPELNVNVREKTGQPRRARPLAGLAGMTSLALVYERAEVRLRRCGIRRDEPRRDAQSAERISSTSSPTSSRALGTLFSWTANTAPMCSPRRQARNSGTPEATPSSAGSSSSSRTDELLTDGQASWAASSLGYHASRYRRSRVRRTVPGSPVTVDVSVDFLKKTTARIFFSRGFRILGLFGSYATICRTTLRRRDQRALLSRRTSLSYDLSYRTAATIPERPRTKAFAGRA